MSKHFPADVHMHSFDTGLSAKRKAENWKLLSKAFRKRRIPLEAAEVEAVMAGQEGAAVAVVRRVFEAVHSGGAPAALEDRRERPRPKGQAEPRQIGGAAKVKGGGAAGGYARKDGGAPATRPSPQVRGAATGRGGIPPGSREGSQAGPGRAGGGRGRNLQRTLPTPSQGEQDPPVSSNHSYQSYGLEDLDDLARGHSGHSGLAPAFSSRPGGYANEAGYVREMGYEGGGGYEHEGGGYGGAGESYAGGGGYGDGEGYGAGGGYEEDYSEHAQHAEEVQQLRGYGDCGQEYGQGYVSQEEEEVAGGGVSRYVGSPRTGLCDEPAEAHGGWDYLGHEKIDGSPEPAPYSRGAADDCSAGAPLLSWDVGQDASGYQDNSSPPFLAERGSGHWASPRGGFPAQSNLSSSRGFGADGGAYSQKIRLMDDFKPYTLKEYRQKNSKEYWNLGTLGPDLGENGLVEKRAAKNKVKALSKEIRAQNRASARSTTAAASKPEKALSARQKALLYAKHVPRPAVVRPAVVLTDQGAGGATSELPEEAALTELEELEIKHRQDQDAVEAIRREFMKMG